MPFRFQSSTKIKQSMVPMTLTVNDYLIKSVNAYYDSYFSRSENDEKLSLSLSNTIIIMGKIYAFVQCIQYVCDFAVQHNTTVLFFLLTSIDQLIYVHNDFNTLRHTIQTLFIIRY